MFWVIKFGAKRRHIGDWKIHIRFKDPRFIHFLFHINVLRTYIYFASKKFRLI